MNPAVNRLKQAVHTAVIDAQQRKAQLLGPTPITDRLTIIRDHTNAGFQYADFTIRDFLAEPTHVTSVRASDCHIGACEMRRAQDRAAWPYGQQLWDDIYGGAR